jgi:quinoprotein glucose dehydrogenase
MRAAAKAAHFRRDTSPRHYAVAARTVLGFSGALLSTAGIVLAAGGLLSPFDGSAFYAVTGVGLAISGALLAKRNRAGAWTYLAVFAATVTWALRNIDYGASLALRLVGPTILLAMLAALMPPLAHWRPRRAAIAFASIMLVTVGIGISSTADGPLAKETTAVTQFLDSEAKGVLQ